jgi:hypothetical protein
MTLNTHDIAIDSQRIRPGLEEKTSSLLKKFHYTVRI